MKLRQARKIIKRFVEFLQREQNEQNLKEYNTLSHKYDRAIKVVNHFSPYGREANRYCQGFSARLRRYKKVCQQARINLKLKAENKI